MPCKEQRTQRAAARERAVRKNLVQGATAARAAERKRVRRRQKDRVRGVAVGVRSVVQRQCRRSADVAKPVEEDFCLDAYRSDDDDDDDSINGNLVEERCVLR